MLHNVISWKPATSPGDAGANDGTQKENNKSDCMQNTHHKTGIYAALHSQRLSGNNDTALLRYNNSGFCGAAQSKHVKGWESLTYTLSIRASYWRASNWLPSGAEPAILF